MVTHMAIEITPSNAKDPIRIPGSHPSKGSEVKVDVGSGKIGSRGSKTQPSSGSQTPNPQAWLKKDSEVKYHKYS